MNLYKYCIFSLFVWFLSSCSEPSSTTQFTLSHSSPRQVAKEWLDSLQKRDAQALLELLEEGSWNRLEQNFKLYFQTLQEISEKPDPNIDKILPLKGKKFLEAFLNWESNTFSSKKFDYKISEIQTGSNAATVTVLGNDQIYKIHLIKKSKNWFVKANYLESFLQEKKTPQK